MFRYKYFKIEKVILNNDVDVYRLHMCRFKTSSLIGTFLMDNVIEPFATIEDAMDKARTFIDLGFKKAEIIFTGKIK